MTKDYKYPEELSEEAYEKLWEKMRKELPHREPEEYCKCDHYCEKCGRKKIKLNW